MTPFATQVGLVLTRSVKRARRDPAMAFIFPVAFPVMMIVLFSQAYEEVGELPGFPAESYVDWIAPAVVLMAAMFGAGHSALGLIEDAQSGPRCPSRHSQLFSFTIISLDYRQRMASPPSSYEKSLAKWMGRVRVRTLSS